MSQLPYGQNERAQTFNMNGHAPTSLIQDQNSYYGSLLDRLTQPQGAEQDHGIFQLLRGLSNEAPWTPLDATTTSRTPGYKPRQSRLIDYQTFGDYRNPAAASDCEDSGYQSMRHSVIDASVYGDQDRGTETQSLFMPLADLQLHSQHHSSPDSLSVDGRHPHKRLWPPRSAANPDAGALVCPTCHNPVKTKAELNKHKQRHEKPFHCNIQGCTRTIGFGTANDLARHQQSVHGMDGIKYRCSEGTCKTKTKDWPRADNFKQHLKRVHQIILPADADLKPYGYKQARTNDLAGLVSSEPRADVPAHPDPLSPWLGFDPAQEPTEFHRMDHAADMSDAQDAIDTIAEGLSERGNEMEKIAEPVEDDHLQLDMGPVLLDLESQHGHIDEITAAPSDIYQDTHIHRPDHLSPSDLMMPAARSEMLRAMELDHLGTNQFHNREDHSPDNSPQDTASAADVRARPLSEEPQGGLSEEDSACSTNEDAMDDIKIKRPDSTPEISASRVKDMLRSKSLDETEASALFESLMEKGILDKLVSKFGYRKAKDDEEELKDSPPSPVAQSSEDAKETKEPSVKDGAKETKCRECGKLFKRACELKKHMKRHQKPYACTHVPDCDKRFGSKNDWKRHENSQHIQLEFWRCTERVKDKERPNVNVLCGKICHRRETFRHHLDKDHSITDPATVEKRCTDCRNGRNFESRFWCGFCQKTIEFEKNGGLAWSERFDHIDAHFTGKVGPKRDISDWKSIELEPLETFQTILPDTRHLRIAPSGAMSDDGSSDEDELSLTGPSRKRRAVGDADDAATLVNKRMRQEKGFKQIDYRSVLWVCCSCECSWSHANTTRCLDQDCRHDFCMRCDFVLPEKDDE